MFNRPGAPIGHFYRVHPDLRVERLPLPPAGVGNSIAFSPDGETMYYTDSPTRTIWRVDYAADGRIGSPRAFVQLPATSGFADGSTVDASGGLWNAQWRGGCVVRYEADGAESARFEVPASQPTCPGFRRCRVRSALRHLGAHRAQTGALEKEPQPAASSCCNRAGVFALRGCAMSGQYSRMRHLPGAAPGETFRTTVHRFGLSAAIQP